ncbi:MAG: LamG-like jellyroll fold domain-containing protein [Cyanobacteria bacterium J06635_15]
MAVLTVKNTLDQAKGSLRAAIKAAKSGDTIRFDPSLRGKTITLNSYNYSIEKNITIDGSNAPGLTINGAKRNILFTVKGKGRAFTLRNLTLANGFHDKYNGAAIRVLDPNAKIRVENSEFRNNTAGMGAAIWAKTNADVTVLNSKFYGNQATTPNDTAAGAISVFDNSKLTVKGSEFMGNKGISGGAIGTIFSQLTLEKSTFKNNTSVRWSGAVHADGVTIPQQKKYYGGSKPRASKGGQIVIRDSLFEKNRSGGHGGAVGIWGYDQDYVTVSGSEFIGNQVTKTGTAKNKGGAAKGGALRISGKQVTVKDSRFVNNQSADEGGALWHQGESPANITNTVFVGNRAAQEGGAIFNHQWDGPGTKVTRSTFKNNQAPKGGAIYKNKARPLTITASKFQNNGSAEIGGNSNNLVKVGNSQGATLTSISSSRAQPKPTKAPIQDPTKTPAQTQESPVAWLKFDQLKGNTASDSALGQDNPAALFGGIKSTKGVKKGAIAFNGQKQYAAIADTKDINLGIHDQRTVSLWFKVNNTSTDSHKQTIYKEGGKVRGLNAYVYDDRLHVGGWNEPTQESGWKGTWLSTDKISSNQWHHLTFVLDGNDSTRPNALKAYLDGKKFGQGAGSQLWTHSGDIGLGSVNGGTKFHDGTEPSGGHRLTGAIDEVKIFNASLNAAQVQGLATPAGF